MIKHFFAITRGFYHPVVIQRRYFGIEKTVYCYIDSYAILCKLTLR